MTICNTLKKFPLGIPLTITSVGTVATLFVGKHLHAGFGIAWSVLSLLHAIQHHKKMKVDAACMLPKNHCLLSKGTPQSSLERLLATIQVKSFVEGRLRVYSPCFVDNPLLKKQVEEYVRSFTGITRAEINLLTGSLLIEYQPQKLRKKPRLATLEQQIKASV